MRFTVCATGSSHYADPGEDMTDGDHQVEAIAAGARHLLLRTQERARLLDGPDEYQQLTAEITEYELIVASPDRQRELVGTDRGEFLASYADCT